MTSKMSIVRAKHDIFYLVSEFSSRSSSNDKRKVIRQGTEGVVVHICDESEVIVDFDGDETFACHPDALEIIGIHKPTTDYIEDSIVF